MTSPSPTQLDQQIDSSLLQAMKFRCIGPPRGGRVVAVAGHPTDPMTFYFGACAGGIWKTHDGGTYWENISDGYLNSSAIGALAVSPSDPNVIYAGMGEHTIRIDVSYGDGVYRSTDGGKSWHHLGLKDTHHIAKIRIHPTDPDLVYVAALGHAFGPNSERGAFRSQDGGKTWEKILYRSDKAGAVDLSLDPNNPRILYASLYETYRTFWTLSSGGPDSSLYRSTDGGDTWEEITDKPGLPEGIKGKMGIAVSPANPSRIWAIIEAKAYGLYRSDDGGDTWQLISNHRDLIHRPWYYCHVFPDPQDADTVYVNDLKMWKSVDGGFTFSEITTPHGDNHDLWIDPHNPLRMVEGNDGGACVSFNGGQTWSSIYNQLTAQFYRIAVDNQYPYRVYGTQQDNSSISVPSFSEKGGIPWSDCYAAGTGESGYIAVDPKDDNVIYVGAVGSSPGGGGALQRYDHRTKQVQLITVWPELYVGWGAGDLKYRFAWTYPILFSPHDPNVLYVTGNHVFRSTTEGRSWEVISPDLSRQDAAKLVAAGGPITLDTSGAEHYGTIYTFVESPHEAGVFWAGTDDGLIHLSQDEGKTWQQVTPTDLPEWSLISLIEASPHDPGTVYMAATRYKLDDYGPYLYKTEDYGQTWLKLGNFPADQITRVIREDPVQKGLLYVGTETGIYFSIDGGESWSRLQNNLPVVPIYDLVIKDGDLVVGTHGRSFWILDDLTPLRKLAKTQQINPDRLALYPPRPTYRQWLGWSVGRFKGPGKNYMMGLGADMGYIYETSPEHEPRYRLIDGGENPPYGVIIYYRLPEGFDPIKDGDLALMILNSQGEEIRRFRPQSIQKSAAPHVGNYRSEQDTWEDPNETFLTTHSGLNRFIWNMRYPDAEKVPDDQMLGKTLTGPLAAPGQYQVRLTAGEKTFTLPFELRIDPRVQTSSEDLQAQFDLWLQITAKLDQTHKAINRIRKLRDQVRSWSERIASLNGSGSELNVMAQTLMEKLTTIESELIQVEIQSASDRLRLPSRLNTKLAELISVLASADAAPPQQVYEVYDYLADLINQQLGSLDTLIQTEIAKFNDQIKASDLPAVMA